jgi:hypothetical protein
MQVQPMTQQVCVIPDTFVLIYALPSLYVCMTVSIFLVLKGYKACSASVCWWASSFYQRAGSLYGHVSRIISIMFAND